MGVHAGSESALDAAEAVMKAAKEAAAEGTAQALNAALETDVTPPDEPAADHITATEPANAGRAADCLPGKSPNPALAPSRALHEP